MAEHWIWLVFVFAFGSCVGSFLNVVIYRMPLDKSLVLPRSSCLSCGSLIAFYDNVPLFSWLFLRGKCRHCKAKISVRYFVIELLTAVIFTCLFYFYFHADIRVGVELSAGGGWLVYLLHIILLSALIAASAIDLELWVIPLMICWFVTAAGFIVSAAAGYLIDPVIIRGFDLFPTASFKTGSLAAGALCGLVLTWILSATGLIKRSYESEDESGEETDSEPTNMAQGKLYHRREACREILYLLPVLIGSLTFFACVNKFDILREWWLGFVGIPAVCGFLGSLWGYIIGCGIVWLTRILGTLGFGKEAMGLGDVHLMGAAGAVIGPIPILIAFFVAPFFGLGWALFQMFFKKTRQIPYGPFLSLGIFIVMMAHDRIFDYIISVFYR